MAESEYIRPTVDALGGVSEGVNIFERLQRIKRTEEEGKRMAEQHLTNKLLDATELKIRNMKVEQAETDRQLRASAADQWIARRGIFDSRVKDARALAKDPIKQMQAVDDIEADFADITAYLPDAATRVSTIANGIRETAKLGFASQVATGKKPAWLTREEAQMNNPGREIDQVWDPVAGNQFVASDRPNMNVVGPVLGAIDDAETPEQLKAARSSKEAAQVRFLPEVQQAYSNKLAALQLAQKAEEARVKNEQESRHKEAQIKETEGKVAAQQGEKTKKRMESKELAIEARTTINEIKFFRDKSKSGKANVENAVGAVQGSKPARLFNRLFNGAREDDQRRLLKVVQMDILSLTKFLRPISEGELDFLRQSVPDINSSDETWMGYLERKQKVMEEALANMEDPNFDPERDSMLASPGADENGVMSIEALRAATRKN